MQFWLNHPIAGRTIIGTVSAVSELDNRELRDIGALEIAAWALHASVPLSELEHEGDGRCGH